MYITEVVTVIIALFIGSFFIKLIPEIVTLDKE